MTIYNPRPMSWQPEVDEIERRRRLALEMGGDEAIGKQHERGRLTVRERIERIADPGSFIEEGRQAGAAEVDEEGRVVAFTPANYVVGFADVGGGRVIVAGEDFTQAGGSPSPAGLRKSIYSEELALKYRLPLVRFLEGGGGSVRGSAGRQKGAPKKPPRPMGEPVYSRARFWSIAEILRTVPVASIGVGAVAGFPAARLVASHFSVMTRHTAQILIGGPALVERALGEKKTKDELGGWEVHSRSGVVDNVAEDEDDAMEQVRRFLSYLPASVDSLPPRRKTGDPADRSEESLLSIVPRDRRFLYDMREIISLVADRDSFFEMTAGYGPSQITGLARVDGHAVGVVANDCRHIGGAMDAAGAQKFRRFIEFCETFHLPILSLVDEPGFMIGSESEASGTIRYGMEAIAATVRTTVPWCAVQIRKSYGVAAAAHYGPGGRVLIWPSAESGALPIEGGVAVAFRREIAAAPDPDKKRAELEAEFAKRRTPFPRAEGFSVHDLIDPRNTRSEVVKWLKLSEPLLASRVR